jgi:uncharacterized spore protein YtfJ
MASEIPTAGPVPPSTRTDELLSTLAERVGARFAASTVFGSPVERDGVTVIPVATTRFGLGGGGGADPKKGQQGDGGGAAGSTAPAGYIEMKGDRTRFVPVVHPARMLALVGGTILAALLILRPRVGSPPANPRRRR